VNVALVPLIAALRDPMGARFGALEVVVGEVLLEELELLEDELDEACVVEVLDEGSPSPSAEQPAKARATNTRAASRDWNRMARTLPWR
jgi:hypothetical protein